MGATPGGVENRGGFAPGGRGRPPGRPWSTTVPPEGCSGPKMRHLVLYKLVDASQADKEPLNGGLC